MTKLTHYSTYCDMNKEAMYCGIGHNTAMIHFAKL